MTGSKNASPREPLGAEGFEERAGPAVSDHEKLLGGLSYVSQIVLPVLLPVILLTGRETKHSSFLRHHAIHSLALSALTIIYYLAAALVYTVGGAMFSCLLCVLWVLFLPPMGILLYYGWEGFRGSRAEIPWLTRLLRDNNLL